jgi:hypothetical protein
MAIEGRAGSTGRLLLAKYEFGSEKPHCKSGPGPFTVPETPRHWDVGGLK